MSIHDAYARRTPFELLLPEADAVADVTEEIAVEAAASGTDPEDRAAFPSLPAVAGYLEEVRGDDAPPRAIDDYVALLFQAFHFHRAGSPLYLLSTEATRGLVDGAGGTPAEPPEWAGYLQLPRHLFWLDEGTDERAESVDGVCWTRTAEGLLHALLATGMRSDRAGLRVVQVPEAPLADASSWLEADVRGDGSDFANTLPGAELETLYAFHVAGEVLKLLGRFFSLLADGRASLTPREPEPGGASADPVPSRLTYARVHTADA